jgi:hypothetical protein
MYMEPCIMIAWALIIIAGIPPARIYEKKAV